MVQKPHHIYIGIFAIISGYFGMKFIFTNLRPDLAPEALKWMTLGFGVLVFLLFIWRAWSLGLFVRNTKDEPPSFDKDN